MNNEYGLGSKIMKKYLFSDIQKSLSSTVPDKGKRGMSNKAVSPGSVQKSTYCYDCNIYTILTTPAGSRPGFGDGELCSCIRNTIFSYPAGIF
jgi:hypothetical protein